MASSDCEIRVKLSGFSFVRGDGEGMASRAIFGGPNISGGGRDAISDKAGKAASCKAFRATMLNRRQVELVHFAAKLGRTAPNT